MLDHKCRNKACVRPDTEHVRLVTRKQNGENRAGAPVNSNTGVLGVSWHKRDQKFQGKVVHNGKAIHVGYFDSVKDAEYAVINKRNELFTHNEKDKGE